MSWTLAVRHTPRRALLIGGGCAMWERSARTIRPTPFPSKLGRYVRLRGQLLDELERRDPALLGRWLDRPGTVNLRRYLKHRADGPTW